MFAPLPQYPPSHPTYVGHVRSTSIQSQPDMFAPLDTLSSPPVENAQFYGMQDPVFAQEKMMASPPPMIPAPLPTPPITMSIQNHDCTQFASRRSTACTHRQLLSHLLATSTAHLMACPHSTQSCPPTRLQLTSFMSCSVAPARRIRTFLPPLHSPSPRSSPGSKPLPASTNKEQILLSTHKWRPLLLRPFLSVTSDLSQKDEDTFRTPAHSGRAPQG